MRAQQLVVAVMDGYASNAAPGLAVALHGGCVTHLSRAWRGSQRGMRAGGGEVWCWAAGSGDGSAVRAADGLDLTVCTSSPSTCPALLRSGAQPMGRHVRQSMRPSQTLRVQGSFTISLSRSASQRAPHWARDVKRPGPDPWSGTPGLGGQHSGPLGPPHRRSRRLSAAPLNWWLWGSTPALTTPTCSLHTVAVPTPACHLAVAVAGPTVAPDAVHQRFESAVLPYLVSQTAISRHAPKIETTIDGRISSRHHLSRRPFAIARAPPVMPPLPGITVTSATNVRGAYLVTKEGAVEASTPSAQLKPRLSAWQQCGTRLYVPSNPGIEVALLHPQRRLKGRMQYARHGLVHTNAAAGQSTPEPPLICMNCRLYATKLCLVQSGSVGQHLRLSSYRDLG
ncbi:hypothetical protein PSPO01_12981 [Paraphaeosphaeria sporulosa]